MRCKVGDLAVIVSGGTTERNIGRFVEILRLSHVPGEWFCRVLGGVAHLECGGCGDEGRIADSRLRPIRPGSLGEETTESRELEVV